MSHVTTTFATRCLLEALSGRDSDLSVGSQLNPKQTMGLHFDLVDLRLFINVARSSSLTQGAAECHISSPAASMRMRVLEGKLGAKLLYRHSRGVILTPAGEAFLRHCMRTMRDIDCLVDEVQDHADGKRGHLRIMADMASMEFLPSALSAFLARHPGVSIDVKERTGREIQPAVRDGAADVGILAAGTPTAGLKGQTYRQDRLVVVAPYRHPLAKRESIRFDETLPFEYVELLEQRAYKGSGTKRGTRKSPKVRVQVGHFGDMCRMIASNFGIGIMPESVACRYSEELKIAIIPLLDDWADQSSFICYRSLGPLPAFAKELIELLLENAAHEGSDLAVPVLS